MAGAVQLPPPPFGNIQENNSFIGDIHDDMSMSSAEDAARRLRQQRYARTLTRTRSENEDPTVRDDDHSL